MHAMETALQKRGRLIECVIGPVADSVACRLLMSVRPPVLWASDTGVAAGARSSDTLRR